MVGALAFVAACSHSHKLYVEIADGANPALLTLELKAGALAGLVRVRASGVAIHAMCASADPELALLAKIDIRDLEIRERIGVLAQELLDHESWCIDHTQGMRLRTTCVETCVMMWNALIEEVNRMSAAAKASDVEILSLPAIPKQSAGL